MKHKILTNHGIVFLISSVLLTGCFGITDNTKQVSCIGEECLKKRAQIVSINSVYSITKEVSTGNKAVIRRIVGDIFPQTREIFHHIGNATFDYDVQFEKIVYTTIDPNGVVQKANALMVYPVVTDGHQANPLISYQHVSGQQPTNFTRLFPLINPKELPSLASVVGWLLASKGFTFIATDQIGYGTNAQVYLQKAEGYAVLDLIKAIRNFKRKHPQKTTWSFNDQNVLIGYSEGGYATMAANHLAKQEQIDLADVYAGAGPFNLNKTVLHTLKIAGGQVQDKTINIKEQLVHIKNAFIAYMHYYPNLPQDIEAYVKDGQYTPQFMKDYIADKHPIRRLIQKSTLSFKSIQTGPDNNIHLFQAKKDQLIPFFNFKEVPNDVVATKQICQLVTQPGLIIKNIGIHQECYLIFLDYIYQEITNQGMYSPNRRRNLMGSFFQHGD